MLRPDQQAAMDHVLSLRTRMRQGNLPRETNMKDAHDNPREPEDLFENLAVDEVPSDDFPNQE